MRALILALLLANPAAAATFSVTNTNLDGPGSLHEAIGNANLTPGLDSVVFNIPGPTPHMIGGSGLALPYVTDPIVIDGTTQPGYAGVPVVIISTFTRPALTLHASNSIVRGLEMHGGDPMARVQVVGDANIIEDCVIPDSYRGTLSVSGNNNIVRRNALQLGTGAGGFLFVTGTGNQIGPANVTALFIYQAADTQVFDNDLGFVHLGAETEGTRLENNRIRTLRNTWTHAVDGYGSRNIFLGNSYSSLETIQIYEAANDPGDADTGGMNNLQNVPILTNASVGETSASVSVELDSSATATQSLLIEFHEGKTGTPDATVPFSRVLHAECVAANSLSRTFTFPSVDLVPGDYIAAIATSYSDSSCVQVLDGSSEFSVAVPVAQTCTPAAIGNFSSDAAITAGETTELFVEATGTNLTYVWYRDDGNGFAVMPGVNTSTITVSPLTTTSYRAEVSAVCGETQTIVITVSVCVPPAVSFTAASSLALVGDEIHLEVDVTGTAPLTIQWFDASGNVVGRDVSSVSFIATAAGSVETTVTATNSCGTTTATMETLVCRRIDRTVRVSPLGLSQAGAMTRLSVANRETLSLIEWYEQDRQGRRLLQSGVSMIVVPSRKTATYVVRMATPCEHVEETVMVGPARRRAVSPGL